MKLEKINNDIQSPGLHKPLPRLSQEGDKLLTDDAVLFDEKKQEDKESRNGYEEFFARKKRAKKDQAPAT